MILYEKPSLEEFLELCSMSVEQLTPSEADTLFHNSIHYALVNAYGVTMAIAGYTRNTHEVFLVLRKGFLRNKFSIIKLLKRLIGGNTSFIAHAENKINQRFAEFFGFKDSGQVKLIKGKVYTKLVREGTK